MLAGCQVKAIMCNNSKIKRWVLLFYSRTWQNPFPSVSCILITHTQSHRQAVLHTYACTHSLSFAVFPVGFNLRSLKPEKRKNTDQSVWKQMRVNVSLCGGRTGKKKKKKIKEQSKKPIPVIVLTVIILYFSLTDRCPSGKRYMEEQDLRGNTVGLHKAWLGPS